jgi:hypothetical protein
LAHAVFAMKEVVHISFLTAIAFKMGHATGMPKHWALR